VARTGGDMPIIPENQAKGTSKLQEEEEVRSKTEEAILSGKWYTVWYSVVGQSMMYTEKGWSIKTLEEAKEITTKDFQNHWWVQLRPNGWMEIRDQDFKLIHTTRKQMKQTGLFK